MNLPTRVEYPGKEFYSSAQVFGEALRTQLQNHPDFYFFSPDETTSNRLSAVFDASERAWSLPIYDWDLHLGRDGRIIEVLSENTLFALLAGHVLSGGRGAMTSYESFLPIVSSQLDQHLKFLKQSQSVEWRPKYPSLNLLSTSCWQRQDHNGYTHQNPALISNLLSKPSNLANCLFPVDDIASVLTSEFIFEQSRHVVNLVTFNKIALPRWIDSNHARFQFDNGGASIFGFTSDQNPEIIISGIGDIPTRESIAAIALIKEDLPELRLRYVGINALSYGAIGTTQNKLSQAQFDELFTKTCPIIFNFHGYVDTLRSIISRYADLRRVDIHGYEDEGSTTSPMDELTRNHCSRWDICINILSRINRRDLIPKYQQIITKNRQSAEQTSLDIIES